MKVWVFSDLYNQVKSDFQNFKQLFQIEDDGSKGEMHLCIDFCHKKMVKFSKAYFIPFDFRKGKTGNLVTMAGQSSAMIGWSWTDVSVLGSQVFGQALMDSCAVRPGFPETNMLLVQNVQYKIGHSS